MSCLAMLLGSNTIQVSQIIGCLYSALLTHPLFFEGMVGPGEEVRLSREPDNPYDGSALP